jgi:N-formylglutamate amidohydrolase
MATTETGLVIPGVVQRRDPLREALPLVLDSPHSGTDYPEDFAYRCPLPMLRRAEDTYVDQLYETAPSYGATLIAALFPRSYIDANRAADDFDPAILARPLPPSLPLRPRPVSRVGLVRRHARPGIPIYDRKLDPEDVLARIERYHEPYHRVLDDSVGRLHREFGAVWHIHCHSMPSYGNRLLGRRGEHGDFVLGDRDGTTCEGAFTDFVARFLRGLGYDVRINEGYKGVEIVRRQGRPQADRHSLQIEVDRSLYMDQKTLEKLPGFARLRADLAGLVEAVAGYVRSRL